MEDQLARFARNLDWNLLRTFVVIVQEGSITAAANRVLLQQPAVSMALKRLEEALGQQLIDRRPGRFEVTEAGKRVYAAAREVFGAVVRLPEVSEHVDAAVTGHIRVHAISQAKNDGWDRMVEEFFSQHPRASISITVETTAAVIRAVERRTATLGLSDGVIPEGIEKCLHSQERYGLFCGRGHEFFGNEDVDISALRGEPYVSFTADVLGGEHMGPVTAVRAFASFGQWVRAASPNVEEVERLILANVGIGMLPVHLAGPLVARGRLWQLPPYDELPTTKTWLIWNRAATLNPAEAAFLSACRAVPAAQHF